MGYQFYNQDTRALIRDENAMFISDTQLSRWINEARRDVAKISGCIQRLITGQSAQGASAQAGNMIAGAIQPGSLPDAVSPATYAYTAQNLMQTIPGVERYPYRGFFNQFLNNQYAGLKGVIDMIQLSAQWEATFLPALTWMPWDDFQAYCRAYSNQTTSYPAVWTVFNDGEDGEVWLFPVPSAPCILEANVACVPADIFSDNDYDAIPEGMRDAVKYRAAQLVMLMAQKYAQADVMGQLFASTIGVDVVARDRGKTPNYYARPF